MKSSESSTMTHALPYRTCEVSDLFSITGDADERRAIVDASAKYLSQFVAPVLVDGEPHCFNCGKPIDAFKAILGIAVSYQWGLGYGEAQCSGCKWPARGMHFPKDATGDGMWSARNLFLAYHPNFVESKL